MRIHRLIYEMLSIAQIIFWFCVLLFESAYKYVRIFADGAKITKSERQRLTSAADIIRQLSLERGHLWALGHAQQIKGRMGKRPICCR